MTSMKVYAHTLQAENYKQFQAAGIVEWWDFSRQFKYAQAWAAVGVFTPAEAKEWAGIVEGDPVLAAEFKSYDFTPETAAPWIRNTLYRPARCAELTRQGKAPRTITQPKPQRTR